MIKRIVETKDVERIEVWCDDCGKLLSPYNRSHTCCMCHKDLCEKCYGTWSSDGAGDYPPVYCKDCLDIGKPYMDEMNNAEKECEDKCEALSNEWRGKCVERRKDAESRRELYPEFQDCSNH